MTEENKNKPNLIVSNTPAENPSKKTGVVLPGKRAILPPIDRAGAVAPEQSSSSANEPELPATFGQKMKELFSDKKNILLLVFFLFLLGITTVVPAGKIPLLRNLVYAMGYSADEAGDMSLLRALFSWNDHAKLARGERPDPDEFSVVGGPFFPDAHGSAPKNQLINIHAVNAFLSKHGRPADHLQGAYYSTGVDENDNGPDIKLKNSNVSAATEANRAPVAEVYFGEDISAVSRNRQDGFDSVNLLKKITNPHISGAGKDDWLGRLVDRASRTDAQLEDLQKKFGDETALAGISADFTLKTHRAKRDMYYAWLMSNAARRTPKVVLKKTLAAAGYNGGDLPKKVFEASGFSGVGVNPDDVVADLDDINLRLKNEELCKEASSDFSINITNIFDSAKTTITKMKSGNYYKKCGEVGQALVVLTTLESQCETVRQGMKNISAYCGMGISKSRSGTCTTTTLQDSYNNFAGYCEEATTACETDPDPETCMSNIMDLDAYRNSIGELKTMKQEIDQSFNVGEHAEEKNDFFPEPDWGRSTFLQ